MLRQVIQHKIGEMGRQCEALQAWIDYLHLGLKFWGDSAQGGVMAHVSPKAPPTAKDFPAHHHDLGLDFLQLLQGYKKSSPE